MPPKPNRHMPKQIVSSNLSGMEALGVLLSEDIAISKKNFKDIIVVKTNLEIIPYSGKLSRDKTFEFRV